MGALGARRSDLLATLAAAAAACALAAATTVSPQLALLLAVVGLVYGLHAADRRAAVVAMWVVWFVTPGIRRILGENGYLAADPLSVAPIAVTALVAALEWTSRPQPREVRRVLLLVAGGLLVGIPTGLASPAAALYALGAYLAGAAAFVIGFNERSSTRDAAWTRALLVGGPLLGAYGIAQYALPLPSWDAAWLDSIDVVPFYAPEPGEVRVFASLNAPGVLGPVLALGLLWYLARPRFGPGSVLAMAVMAVALSLTYLRSAWVALIAAVVAFLLLSRGRRLPRVAALVAACVLVPLALSPVNPTAASVVERFGTLRELEDDTSANERVATPTQLIPQALARPLGAGLGTAGEASRLAPAQPLRAPDNAYLSLLFQTGPIGFLLVFAGVGAALALAVRRTWRRAREPLADRALVLSAFVFVLVAMFTGDHLYGVIGVAFWYLLGLAARPVEEPAAPQRRRAGTGSSSSSRAARAPGEALAGADASSLRGAS
jgi:O-antigen ligase